MSDSAPSIRVRLRAAVQDVLPCQVLPIQMALAALLEGEDTPRHTALACVFGDGDAALSVGVALDLVHQSLHRLHARVDTERPEIALLGAAGTVLGGDYLTSGAFKLLVRCRDLKVLGRVAAAITRTCELECDALDAAGGSELARSLGAAAAQAGAALAGLPEPAQELAARYGAEMAAAHAEHDAAAAQRHLDAASVHAQALAQDHGCAAAQQLLTQWRQRLAAG